MTMNYRRKKYQRFAAEDVAEIIDYKNLAVLSGFIAETGKIVPRRITGVSAAAQRRLAEAIKRARFLSLLKFCDQHK